MDNQSAANPSPSALIRFWPWFVLLLILLCVGFIRFRLLDMPLERDEGEYAYAGQLILQGIPPYELAYNMKLPGTYYACALGMALFGQTIAGMHSTLIVVNSLTIVFVFLLARKLFGVGVGLVAAASYALMSVSPFVLGMATHANQFVVLFAVPATWLLWKGCEENRRRLFFLSGLLYGLAFLMKQQGVFFGAFGGCYLIWNGVGKRNFSGMVKTILIYSSGVLLPFVCLCFLMAWEGVFSRFWFWTFTYAHSYVAITTWANGLGWLTLHLKSALKASVGLWLLGIMGLLLGLFYQTLRARTLFVAGFWVFAFLGTATGLYFRAHYFILVLPAFSILIGVAVEALQKNLLLGAPVYLRRTVALGLFAAILGWSIFYQRQLFFSLPGDSVIETIYQGYPFVQSVAAASYIRQHSPPDARIAIIGSEPEIYFYSQRHSASGYIYIYALNEPQPNAGIMQLDMINEIEAARPEYIVWVGYYNSWLLWPTSDMTLSQWATKYIHKYYARVGVVDTTGGKIICVWDQDAATYGGPYGNHITVYKRLDAAGISPKKN
jgi:4-amino-4-deoxy-L-arabinose transferase-like glycosyltransferase